MAVTAVLFPIQYLSLEIPKQIINGAIGAGNPTVVVLGLTISQVSFLAILCAALLVTIIVQGLMKMRLNTMKGMLSESMLKRFRYMLTTRLFRFPPLYFQRTSQGELVSMVTSESEALGGMMGDAISQPLFQGGQMLTILGFLMVQSPWLGLAAAALIPLQAWLIPRMQRRINLLSRERVKEVRKFATVIGESAEGAVHLRRGGGLHSWTFRISDRLTQLAAIRFEIYKKKFFMKFVNNFITQLTPLMFFAFGGYLTIQGDLTVGALVAALAAHKDLAAPWKELLTYYNQVQETGIRYLTITERFAPDGMLPETDPDGPAQRIDESLSGDIEFANATVLGEDGAPLLKDLTLTVPQGARVGFDVDNEETIKALADLITRERLPATGQIRVAGKPLAAQSQTTISRRIGYAGPRVFVHQGTYGENALLPVLASPPKPEVEDARGPGDAPTEDLAKDSATALWLDLLEAMDARGAILRVALDLNVPEAVDPGLAARLADLRGTLSQTIANSPWPDAYAAFDKRAYIDGLPIAANLFFAVPQRPVSKAELLAQAEFRPLLQKLGLERDMLMLTHDLIDLLQRIFGVDGIKHPLFQRLGLSSKDYSACTGLLPRLTADRIDGLSDDDVAQLLVIPFSISADQLGVDFPSDMKDRIVALRPEAARLLDESLTELLSALEPKQLITGLSVFENLIFGKLRTGSGPKAGELRQLVDRAVRDAGLARDIYLLLAGLPTDIGGANLSATLTEALELSRAMVKKPDILLLDQAMASLVPEDRRLVFERLRTILPETTFIHLECPIEDREQFDEVHEIRHTQLVSADAEQREPKTAANPASVDLTRKIALLEGCELFRDLEQKQLQLLAFGARWYDAPAGTLIFSLGDEPFDGAYLIAEGTAELFVPHSDGSEEHFAKIEPGILIGELALLNGRRRSLSLRADKDVRALRIGAEEFLTVIENDIGTAVKLLRVLSGYAAPKLK
ncbi:MAG: ABC transporter transmembrane domain-containing protein [Pseudomonadota bacterium]